MARNIDIPIKSTDDIQKMRVACQLAADALLMVGEHVRVGISTEELDNIAHDYIVNRLGCIPAPLNYRGFPKSICTSINHQVCHGIPSPDKILKKGDIINVDITVIKDGYHGDNSMMFTLDEPSIKAKRLIDVTYDCMVKGIQVVREGNTFRDIALAIQNHAHANRYSVVKEYCGHGIGKLFHEDPQVIHCVTKDPVMDVEMKAGMIFTIEPMINLGKAAVKTLGDNWTVVTRDRSLSAQWEHTILVTPQGFEVLTIRDDDSPLIK